MRLSGKAARHNEEMPQRRESAQESALRRCGMSL